MKFRDLHRNIKIRLGEMFLSNLVGNMIFPFMAIYFAGQFGEAITGVLFVSNILAGVVSGAFGGHFADRYGRRRIMLIAEIIRLFVLALMTFGNSPWYHSAWLTMCLMLVINFCGGLSVPASQAMVVDCSNADNRKLIYSLDYWGVNASLLFGGMIGGLFFQAYLFQLLVCLTSVSILSVLLLIFFIKETYHVQTDVPALIEEENDQNQAADGMVGGYAKVFRDKTFMFYIVACIFLLAIENISFNYSGIRLAKEMTSQTMFAWHQYVYSVDGVGIYGILRAENALIVVCFTILMNLIFKHFADKWVLLSGIVLTAIGYCIIDITNQPWLLLVCMMLSTFGEMMHATIRQTFLADMIPRTNRGSYMAISGLVGVGANLMGAGGISLGAFSSAWVIGGVVLVLGILSVVIFQVILSNMADRQAVSQTQAEVAQSSSI